MTQRVISEIGACEISSLPGQSQIAVLRQAGWMLLAEFKNHRSCEVTQVWGTHP